MKKTTLILGGLLLTLSSCGKGSDSSSKYYSSHSYYSSSSSSSKRSYTATDLVNYLVENGRKESSGSYYLNDIIPAAHTYLTLAAVPDTLSFRVQAIKLSTEDEVSMDLIIYHEFTWGSITSGTYPAALVVSKGTKDVTMEFGFTVLSLYDDYEIHEYKYLYQSSYGLSKDTVRELASTTVTLYNAAIVSWNNNLENLAYPTIR